MKQALRRFFSRLCPGPLPTSLARATAPDAMYPFNLADGCARCGGERYQVEDYDSHDGLEKRFACEECKASYRVNPLTYWARYADEEEKEKAPVAALARA